MENNLPEFDERAPYAYYKNEKCPYFPCHEKAGTDFFNCLFCYCPLYALGDKCGGNFKYTENGVKDCSACLVPHSRGGYKHIMANFPKIAELAKRKQS